MQVCTLLQTDNHAIPHPSSFLQAGCPSCCALVKLLVCVMAYRGMLLKTELVVVENIASWWLCAVVVFRERSRERNVKRKGSWDALRPNKINCLLLCFVYLFFVFLWNIRLLFGPKAAVHFAAWWWMQSTVNLDTMIRNGTALCPYCRLRWSHGWHYKCNSSVSTRGISRNFCRGPKTCCKFVIML